MMRSYRHLPGALGLLLAVGLHTAAGLIAAEPAPRLVEVRMIWEGSSHCAFTDLVRFRDGWICAFREGTGHVSLDGRIRVIGSPDGRKWKSLALLESSDPKRPDLRDPKISVTPQGRLLLTTAAAFRGEGTSSHQSYSWFSEDGTTWGNPVPIGDTDFWLWRVSWHEEKAYSIGYRTGPGGRIIRLYTGTDGRRFEPLVPTLFSEGYPNETSILFEEDGKALCLLRRDEAPFTAQLGTARPPYTQWTWKDLGVRVGGPHMIRLPDGRYLAAVRLYDGRQRTSLMWLDPEAGSLSECLTLPSGGDTSYAGLVWHEERLWVSYYSSHEGKSRIYLAEVAVE